MKIIPKLNFNKKTMTGLEKMPNSVLYRVAKETLDYSTRYTPMSQEKGHSGTLRRSTKAFGVRGGNGDYYIGSPTDYATYVWSMPQATTNWTTPNTGNKWFARTLKEKGRIIIKDSITKGWKENM